MEQIQHTPGKEGNPKSIKKYVKYVQTKRPIFDYTYAQFQIERLYMPIADYF